MIVSNFGVHLDAIKIWKQFLELILWCHYFNFKIDQVASEFHSHKCLINVRGLLYTFYQKNCIFFIQGQIFFQIYGTFNRNVRKNLKQYV